MDALKPPGQQERERLRAERLKDVHRVRGLEQQVTEEPAIIRRHMLAAIRYYRRDPKEDLPSRIKYGWKGQLDDKRELTDRIVRALTKYVRANLDITYRDKVFLPKDQEGVTPEKIIESYLLQLEERFPLPAVLWEKLSFGARTVAVRR